MYEHMKFNLKIDKDYYDIKKYWNNPKINSKSLSSRVFDRIIVSQELMNSPNSEFKELMWVRNYTKIDSNSWLKTPINETIMALARNIIVNRNPSVQPILADALEEAGWQSPKLDLFRKCEANPRYYLFFHLAGIVVWTP